MSMLARVASNLYWIGRYLERAENTARLLDTARRMAALPGPDGHHNEWESVLASSGSDYCFPETGNKNDPTDVVYHLVLAPSNPSSIYSSLQKARNNARSIREGLSWECWHTLNNLWLEFKDLTPMELSDASLPDIIETTKYGCMTVNGSIESTVLRNETYHFVRLGTFSERADSTARILDVKYFSLLPPGEPIEGALDSYQWMTLLTATSTRRLFRRIYGTDLRAETVSDLLIKNDDCARSLVFCISQICDHLSHLSDLYDRQLGAMSAASTIRDEFVERSVDDIIIGGLHDYLGAFMRANNSLAQDISRDFYFEPVNETSDTDK
ncbi:alpha-E domain-containing protein [Parvularcula sp. LCG005]|uniref:alpha-E domain-containing protein n=1 Tax=Parvularcula sp. LCG005 TaxID=3078805 RepID=UPI0029421BA0|nr:alpha-E domain-containing protein [Parvularcula sp. LCG005]WOI51997.1 alpha-E domain-containing protein [Parvularcula sp. LCG005]